MRRGCFADRTRAAIFISMFLAGEYLLTYVRVEGGIGVVEYAEGKSDGEGKPRMYVGSCMTDSVLRGSLGFFVIRGTHTVHGCEV